MCFRKQRFLFLIRTPLSIGLCRTCSYLQSWSREELQSEEWNRSRSSSWYCTLSQRFSLWEQDYLWENRNKCPQKLFQLQNPHICSSRDYKWLWEIRRLLLSGLLCHWSSCEFTCCWTCTISPPKLPWPQRGSSSLVFSKV